MLLLGNDAAAGSLCTLTTHSASSILIWLHLVPHLAVRNVCLLSLVPHLTCTHPSDCVRRKHKRRQLQPRSGKESRKRRLREQHQATSQRVPRCVFMQVTKLSNNSVREQHRKLYSIMHTHFFHDCIHTEDGLTCVLAEALLVCHQALQHTKKVMSPSRPCLFTESQEAQGGGCR